MSRLALLVLLFLAAAPARAQKVAAVLSSDLDAYAQALAAFEGALGSTAAVVPVAGRIRLSPETRVVLALGGRAARKRYPAHVVVIRALAPGVTYLPVVGEARVVNVRTVLRPEALVSRAKALKPGLTALAVVWSQRELGAYVARLADAGREKGLEILSAHAADPADLPLVLRALPARAGAVWLAPDPTLLDEDGFVIARSYARARGVPLYAPLDTLVAEGADAALAPSIAAIGRAAAEEARKALAGLTPEPERFVDDAAAAAGAESK